jgi:hypothetical protein
MQLRMRRRIDDNAHRPHSSLGKLTPREFAMRGPGLRKIYRELSANGIEAKPLQNIPWGVHKAAEVQQRVPNIAYTSLGPRYIG